jgi:hypothetical protein
MIKILSFHYFGGAGGKFISNCLSMSGQVALSHYKIFSNYYASKDIKIIENALLDTIPPKNESRTWLFKELGCKQLFGQGIDLVKNKVNHQNSEFNDVEIFSNVWLPIGTHTIDELTNIKKYFSTQQFFSVAVLGNAKFIDHAIRLKWPNSHHCLDLDAFQTFNNDLKNEHFDHIIHAWNPLDQSRLDEIKILSAKIKVEYDNRMAAAYIDKYQNFHN